ERLPSLDQLLLAGRQLPAAVGTLASTAAGRHHVGDRQTGVHAVQAGHTLDGVVERWVSGDVGDHAAVEVHRATVAERGNVIGTGLEHDGSPVWVKGDGLVGGRIGQEAWATTPW